MPTYNDLTLDNCLAIKQKAKTKQDGVYTFRGIGYRIQNNFVTHYATKNEILLNAGNFVTIVGQYDTREDGQKLLKGLI